jgi:hypothetical protein
MRCGGFKVGYSLFVLVKPIVRHADQDIQALFIRRVWGAACKQRSENVDGSSKLTALEESEAEVEAQGREGRVECQGFLVEGHGLVVALLACLEKSEVGICLGVVGMRRRSG